MRRQNCVVLLLVIALIWKTNGQETTEGATTPTTTTSAAPITMTTKTNTPTVTPWHGDPNLCPPNPEPGPPQPEMPNFGEAAEFSLEQIEYEEIGPTGIPGHKVMQQHLYDYNANSLIIVKNRNGLITSEYFYYGERKKSVYIGSEICGIQPITENKEMDGTSAIQFPNNTWHLRPLNEYLLFSNLDSMRPPVRKPMYTGSYIIRGIPVDTWQTCYIVPEERRTVRRVWSLARKGVVLPSGKVENLAVPIQGIIQASVALENGTIVAEADEIYNVFDFKQGIQESASDLSPPKGVFCTGGNPAALVSLDQLGIYWPDFFSVRVETSTTRLSKWERFHLRYDSGRRSGSRRIRYDYLPSGADDFRSVIHDYTDNLTYSIDRRVGSCQVTRGVEYPDVSPLRNPIEFFIKHERHTIFDPPKNQWQFNGYRSCRGKSIKCIIATAKIDNFPPMVNSDTGVPTGDTWLASNIEYAWGMRAPATQTPPNLHFDYPVSLFMKMYRFPDPLNPNPLTIESQNVEYEFYELNRDRSPYDFDISTCYRANAYEYFHSFFTIKIGQDNVIDGDKISLASLEFHVVQTIRDKSKISKYHRIADLEIEHETVGNTLNVFFTMLGQTRIPETESFDNTEPTAEQALKDLKSAINSGDFKFQMNLTDAKTVDFTAEKDSLRSSTEYMSTHTRGSVVTVEEYSGSAKAVAIVVGLLIGLIVGILLIVIIRVIRKEPIPFIGGSVTNPVPSVNYSARKNNTATDA